MKCNWCGEEIEKDFMEEMGLELEGFPGVENKEMSHRYGILVNSQLLGWEQET